MGQPISILPFQALCLRTRTLVMRCRLQVWSAENDPQVLKYESFACFSEEFGVKGDRLQSWSPLAAMVQVDTTVLKPQPLLWSPLLNGLKFRGATGAEVHLLYKTQLCS